MLVKAAVSELTVKAFNKETPPLAWGRRSDLLFYCAGRRNTPTRVGKTLRAQKLQSYESKLSEQKNKPQEEGEAELAFY